MQPHERRSNASSTANHLLGNRGSLTRGLISQNQILKQIDDGAKRLLDIAGAVGIGIVLSPVLICGALALFLTGVRPVIFKQQRVGAGNRPFTMFKFRTLPTSPAEGMTVTADERAQFILELTGGATPNSETGLYKQDALSANCVGRFLRQYSIDELPQLWNVIRGDMSLVGPRPALVWEADLFSPTQKQRHRVKPGMTGLWQVSGRNALSTAQMIELDLAYVEQRNTWLDLKILLQTPKAVLFKKLTR
jgi:lipopolysaccharide/colanic/teichoic acid biosynthesis glycosyltransferase